MLGYMSASIINLTLSLMNVCYISKLLHCNS